MADTTKIRIRLKAFDHQLLDKSTSDIVETAKRTGARVAGPIPLPTRHPPLHRPPRPARRQEVARAVRDPHPQAPARHPRADAADPRRADEARPVGRRRRRDQVAELRKQTHGKRRRLQPEAREGRRDRARGRRLRRRGQGAPLLRSGEGAARVAARRAPRPPKSASAVSGSTQEALQAEGHRPRASRLDPRADLRRRRPGAPAAARATGRYRPPRQVRIGALKSALSLVRQGRPPHRGRQLRARRDQDQGARSRRSARCRRTKKALVVDDKRQREPQALDPQLRRSPVPAARGRQRLRPAPARHLVLSKDAAKALEARCLQDELRKADAAPETIIRRPIILTEKSQPAPRDRTRSSSRSLRDANKIQIRDAVQKLFNVKVASVNTMRLCAARIAAWAAATPRLQNWKKAIVTLKEGDDDPVLRRERRSS